MQYSGSLLGDARVKVLIATAFHPFLDYQVTGTRVAGHLPHSLAMHRINIRYVFYATGQS